jgi:hypothetical protein
MAHIKKNTFLCIEPLIHCQFHKKYLSQRIFVISSLIIPETFAVLGFWSQQIGSYKQSKTTVWPLKMGPIGCLDMSVTSYQSTLRKIPGEGRFHLQSGESLKPQINFLFFSMHLALQKSQTLSSLYRR